MEQIQADDRLRKRRSVDYLAMFTGGLVFARGYTWTMEILPKGPSVKNIAIGLVTCSAAASVSSVAFANLLFMHKTSKIRSRKNLESMDSLLEKIQGSAESAEGTDPVGTDSETTGSDEMVDRAASGDPPLDLKTEESGMYERNELEILGDKADATVACLNSSMNREGSAGASGSEKKQKLAEQWKEMDAEKVSHPLSEKNKKICKDIGTLLKNAKFPATATCSPKNCFFCSKESSEEISLILNGHESRIKDDVIKRKSSTSDSNSSLASLSASEISGAVLHTQITGLLRDYERHRQLGSADERNSNVLVLHRLLGIVLDDFSNAQIPKLDVAVDAPQLQDAVSEKLQSMEKVIPDNDGRIKYLEDYYWQSIEKNRNFQKRVAQDAGLSGRFEDSKETDASSCPYSTLKNCVGDSTDQKSSFLLDVDEEGNGNVAFQPNLNASEFPLLHAIESPFLHHGGLGARPGPPVLYAKSSSNAAGEEFVEPQVEIPWPRIDEADHAVNSGFVQQPATIEEIVDFVTSGVEDVTSIHQDVSLDLEKPLCITVPKDFMYRDCSSDEEALEGGKNEVIE